MIREVVMNQSGDKRVSFCEVQQFRNTWVLFIVLPISLFLIILFSYGMVKQLILGHPTNRDLVWNWSRLSFLFGETGGRGTR